MPKLPPLAVITPPYVHFDDTGCNVKTQPWFTWAGYLASYSAWDVFRAKWAKILDRRPTIPYWHQTDARARARRAPKNPFADLSDAQLARKERALCGLITEHRSRLMPMAFRVSHAHIQTYVTGKITFARTLSRKEAGVYRPALLERPHLIALVGAAKYAVDLMGGLPDKMPVSFYCEQRKNDPYQDFFEFLWKGIASREPLLGSIGFVEGKVRSGGPVQAADILAWHLNFRAAHPREPDDPMWGAIDGPALRIMDVDADLLRYHVNFWNSYSPPPIP